MFNHVVIKKVCYGKYMYMYMYMSSGYFILCQKIL